MTIRYHQEQRRMKITGQKPGDGDKRTGFKAFLLKIMDAVGL